MIIPTVIVMNNRDSFTSYQLREQITTKLMPNATDPYQTLSTMKHEHEDDTDHQVSGVPAFKIY